MPMCDAYIPQNVLTPEAERKLFKTVSEILVSHEMRSVVELMDSPELVEESKKRAQSMSWMFVHRLETYVGGEQSVPPIYRFVVNVPQGQLDEIYIPAINREIITAIREAEAGKWPELEHRLWIFAYEVPNGTWGAGGRPLHLGQIIDFIAPGWGNGAITRAHERRAKEAAEFVALAESHTASV